MWNEDIDLLVDAARVGGGWAFGRLWEELSPTVAAYLRGRGVRDADDVTSEVFLAAFRGIERFDGDGRAFRSWLFSIAHHKGVDAVRRGASVREVPVETVSDGRTTASAEDGALESLERGEVSRLLCLLTVEQRDVLLLRIVGELSLAETAAAIGKPVGAVKQLQHRALARLRKEIPRQPITQDPVQAIAWMR
jgi:RNA polymerase sigma-70 factor (ECF subfamily)